jgi:hypothetical protein
LQAITEGLPNCKHFNGRIAFFKATGILLEANCCELTRKSDMEPCEQFDIDL